MKSIPGALLARMQGEVTDLAYGLKVTRQDGYVAGYTSHVEDVVIDGVTYRADPGLELSSIVTTSGLAVGNLELRTPNDGIVFPATDVFSRKWDHAEFEIFRFAWGAPEAGKDVLLSGHFGELELRDGEVHVELRSLAQYLQQPVGSASSRTCRYRLGDARCRVDLDALRVTGTVTQVTSQQVFRDSARTEPDDWFGEGVITFTSGQNSGISAKIRSYAADGTFTLFLPLVLPVSVGNSYSAVPGCRKRLEEDCRDKYNNVLNFGGEPHRPGTNQSLAPGTAGV